MKVIIVIHAFENGKKMMKDFCVFLNVVPPEIQDDGQPVNLTVTLKQPLTLGCDAFGIPSPTITWTKDNRPVRSFNRD